MMDCVLALTNLKTYARLGMLDDIVTDLAELEGKYFNPLTDTINPPRTPLKPTEMQKISRSIRTILNELPSITKDFVDSLPEDNRKKPLERGLNHVHSGHVILHSLGRSAPQSTLLIVSQCLASYRKDTVYKIATEWNGNELLNIYCNCPNGNIFCSHKAAILYDIIQYLLRERGKFLCIRPKGQQNLLATCRLYPFTYIKTNILPTLGAAFVVSPTLLSRPELSFKPSKSDWIEIKKIRKSTKERLNKLRKEKKSLVECLCEKGKEGETIECRCCLRLHHEACVDSMAVNFFCPKCTDAYCTESRPPIKSFSQIQAILEEEGVALRIAKKEKAQKSNAALQGRNIPQERHDIHASITYTRRGVKRRRLSFGEKEAMQELDERDVDVDQGIMAEGDLESDSESRDSLHSDDESGEESLPDEEMKDVVSFESEEGDEESSSADKMDIDKEY